MNGSWPEGPVLVVGFARTGRAVAEVLARHGVEVRAIDDALAGEVAPGLGVELHGTLAPAELERLVRASELVVTSPGVPPSHPAHLAAAALGVPLVSEVELAWRLASAPIVAVTGTNGKTTVTGLVAAMAQRSGREAVAAGNIGFPLVEAVLRPALDLVVAEVSSFQLAGTHGFHPVVAGLLNLDDDHLDWHGDAASYHRAKARIFANQLPGDVAVGNAEDAPALTIAAAGAGRLVTFGLGSGDYHLAGERLVGPDGATIAERGDLLRDFPHDVANALAATALAEAAGIDRLSCRAALGEVAPLPHRVQLVGRRGGIDFYDDSKATTPGAVCAALAGVGSCVLIAGGRNKGLDLADIARAPAAASVRAVVAIGEAAGEVIAAFGDQVEVVEACSMREAVATAARLAGGSGAGAVLLSPGCASFDWYTSYGARGDDFAAAVSELAGAGAGTAAGGPAHRGAAGR
ncbi:MAG TPA: UDP-N-acetylmuramoyl-L-alanine--D-glutamate ligase [Acidimicrobiales bacterium]|nr:UDP-N-acetylmuramoyl-L-alanine--D-glutamate ligase [Acidimicrobiales bacterium]